MTFTKVSGTMKRVEKATKKNNNKKVGKKIMREIKNFKNCTMETLSKRLIELQEIIAPYEEEITNIKNEIKARDTEGTYTYECDTCTVTSRVSTSERLDTKKIKEVFENWKQYTSTSISHTVKVNPKKSKKK